MCVGLALDWFCFVKGFDVIRREDFFIYFLFRNINEKTAVIPGFNNEKRGRVKNLKQEQNKQFPSKTHLCVCSQLLVVVCSVKNRFLSLFKLRSTLSNGVIKQMSHKRIFGWLSRKRSVSAAAQNTQARQKAKAPAQRAASVKHPDGDRRRRRVSTSCWKNSYASWSFWSNLFNLLDQI